jgi:hypothetical protein
VQVLCDCFGKSYLSYVCCADALVAILARVARDDAADLPARSRCARGAGRRLNR